MTEPTQYRLGRLALRCWVIALVLFVLSFVVGIIASIVGSQDDSVQTFAPIFFPLAVGLVTVPLLIAAVVLSIRSFVREGANVNAVLAHVLSLLGLLPLAFIIFFALNLFLGSR